MLPRYQSLLDELNDLKSWKSNVTKALWIIFVAVVGVFIKMFFD